MTHIGIDYGLGQSNIDHKSGIRYGVISQNSINLDCTEDFEHDYGTPHCPECGNDVSDASDKPEAEDWDNYRTHGCNDYVCETCEHWLDSGEVYSEESLGWSYQSDGYHLADCLDNDIMVLASPYYTFAQFCSPCVPGAGNLDSAMEGGVKTYCLGHDWFEDSKAPYPVYRVSDDAVVTE